MKSSRGTKEIMEQGKGKGKRLGGLGQEDTSGKVWFQGNEMLSSRT